MTWLLSNLGGKIAIGIAIAVALGFGMMEVRGCMRKDAEVKFLKQTLKNQSIIDAHDKVVDQTKKQEVDDLQKSLEGKSPDEQAELLRQALDRYFQWQGEK